MGRCRRDGVDTASCAEHARWVSVLITCARRSTPTAKDALTPSDRVLEEQEVQQERDVVEEGGWMYLLRPWITRITYRSMPSPWVFE